MYGAVAAGLGGAKQAAGFLRDEIDMNLAQIGCPRFDELSSEFLFGEDFDDWQRNTREARS